MSRRIVRKNDLWAGVCVCCPAAMSGPVITYSPNVFTNNRNVARIWDLVMGWCGHVGPICEGSPDVFTNNRKTARLHDATCACCVGQLVTASPDVYVNDAS